MIKKLVKQEMAVGVEGQKIVFYGGNDHGKTKVAIELGKAICKKVSDDPEAAPTVLSFEHGTNATFGFYYVDGTDYLNAKECIDDYCNEMNYKFIMKKMPVLIIDGAEKIPTIAKNFVTSKKEIEVLGDLAYGKGFDIFKSYTDAPFIKLMSLKGVTIIFIFHEEVYEDEHTKARYVFPSGTAKENGVCQYIRDNSDFTFYLERPTLEDGTKGLSRAYCNATNTHFGRNRYAEGIDKFDIDFNAKSVYDYIEECGRKLAELKGVEFTSVVEKQEINDAKKSKEELIEEANRIGKILFGTSAKDRTVELVSQYAEGTPHGLVGEITDIKKLEYLVSDLIALASDKGIEI